MVTLHFKLSERDSIEMSIDQPEELGVILDRCVDQTGAAIGDVIAIRNGRVVPLRDLVRDGDVIELFPALSGG